MRNELLKSMDNNSFTYEDLAQKTNCSPAVLSKFLFKKETIKFDIVLDVAKELCPSNESWVMQKYSEELTRPSDIKRMLEYFAVNSQYDYLDKLLDESSQIKNKELQEWMYVYRLLHDWKTGKIEAYIVENEIIKFKTRYNDLNVLLKIIEINILYNRDDFNNVNRISPLVKKEISKLNESYIKQSFWGRYYQVLAHVSLYVNNDPIAARGIAKAGLNKKIGDKVNSFFYNIIATSHFDESIIEMNHYALESINLLKNTFYVDRVKDIKNRFNKLNYIMKGMNGEINFYDDVDDPLDDYIKGVESADIYALLESYSRFIQNGDYFFSKLPEQKLIDLGCNMSLITAIRNIK